MGRFGPRREISIEQYNKEVDEYLLRAKNGGGYSQLNRFVMEHTYDMVNYDRELRNYYVCSRDWIRVYRFDEDIDYDFVYEKTTNIFVSKKRSFEAARAYKNKKVAVLDFANAIAPGGAPWSAGAQEESLCRISTLQQCLYDYEDYFYKDHKDYGFYGTDDLMYVPNVVVFKTDESAPKMLDKEDWYKVDVIVSAAPDLSGKHYETYQYRDVIKKRLRKVLQLAQANGVEVLILGAWGCGAFDNPPSIVAEVFHELLDKYYFQTVEFAIDCSRGSTKNYDAFIEVFGNTPKEVHYSDLIRKATQISFEAHKDDVDKGGYPYFMHPLHLAEQFNDEASICVALLHDVIEDHGDKYSFEYFKQEGFTDEIITALKLLTHDKSVDYLEYVKKIKENPIARRVKLADLKHNSDASRTGDKKPAKYETYQNAIEILE